MTALDFPAAIGWNTWDVQYHTGWVHLPDGLRVRLVVIDADSTVWDDVTWRRGMTRMGRHSIDGSYTDTSWQRAGLSVRARAAAAGSTLLVSVTTESAGAARCGVVIDVSPAASAVLPHPVLESGSLVRAGDHVMHVIDGTIRVLDAGIYVVDGAEFGLVVDGEPLDGSALASRIDGAERTAAASEVSTGGWLGEAGQAMSRAVTWNTIYVPGLDRVLTPTSRDFVITERDGFYGSWAVHAWDSFFTALVASTMDQNFASTIVDQILRFATPDGMLPNRISDDRGATLDRSQPPVGGTTLLEAYRGSGLGSDTRDRHMLEMVLPALVRWHDWWVSARVGPFGMLTWGSDPVDGDEGSGTMDRARRESGLDDSPMYDGVVMDEQTHTIDLADVGLNALHIADARALAELATVVGDHDLARRMTREAEAAAARFDAVFWSEEAGLYLNRWSDGRFSPSISPTMFYPLLAGIPSAERARAMAERLLAPEVLGGEPPLTSVARNDPGFDNHYWRGRVWAPIVYLAVNGLRRYGLDDLSSPVVSSLLELFLHEWTERSSVRENYPARLGEDVTALEQRSDSLMAWGGLLGLLAIGEVTRPTAEGWRFAHPGRAATVNGLQLAEGTLSVIADGRLTVRLNERVLLEAPFGAVITGMQLTDSELRATITLTGGEVETIRIDFERELR
ncbi:MAG: hypothetical protein JWO50_915 [Candidatus Kaiserbacteria bacterium]|jgi:hypothetical protein|nr:hypothetical protein [Candidatus Kaiserbacteria bacterium]